MYDAREDILLNSANESVYLSRIADGIGDTGPLCGVICQQFASQPFPEREWAMRIAPF
jgi:hypothetical protein